MIRVFEALTGEERQQLWMHLSSLGHEMHVDGFAEMVEKYGGEVYDYGRGHFSLWANGQVVGSLGVITREIPERGEAFITGAYIARERLEDFPRLLTRALAHLLPYEVNRVSLGIPPTGEYLLPLLEEQGFCDSHMAMILCHRRDAPDRDPGVDVELVRLNPINGDEFRRIYNRTLAWVPNGGSLSEKDLGEMLNSQVTAGLCVRRGEPVGVYQLMEGTEVGWIEAIGVDPDFQGQGIGWSLLTRLTRSLYASGSREVKLGVMSSNRGALRLYHRCRFEKDRVTGIWLVMNADRGTLKDPAIGLRG